MNNLVFTSTAAELKTTMYGYNQSSLTLQQLQLDSSGNMLISGDITVSNAVTIANTTLTVSGDVTIANAVTIANTTLTVSGDVTIANAVTIANTTLTVSGDITVANAVTIANTTLTVSGDVTVANAVTIANTTLTVSGDVTIANAVTIANTTLTVSGDVTISNEVTIANSTLTVQIGGQTFTSSTDSLASVTGTGNVFTATNISELTTASMFIDNTGTNTVTYSLQLSPDGTVYFDDPSYTNLTVAGGENTIIAIAKYAQYAQLQYNLGATTATFNAYYNGQA